MTPAVRRKGRYWGTQQLDHAGNCQHQVRVFDGRAGRWVWIWCIQSECNWCGSGRMWQ